MSDYYNAHGPYQRPMPTWQGGNSNMGGNSQYTGKDPYYGPMPQKPRPNMGYGSGGGMGSPPMNDYQSALGHLQQAMGGEMQGSSHAMQGGNMALSPSMQQMATQLRRNQMMQGQSPQAQAMLAAKYYQQHRMEP